jgi:hypothetical protein
MTESETTKEFKRWTADVRRRTSRERCFGQTPESSWNAVAGLAQAMQDAGMKEADLNTLIDLAVDMLVAEIKSKGLPTRPRRTYRDAIDMCFSNLCSFWSKNPVLHIVGELSWLVERARERSMDAGELLLSEIGLAALWEMPYLGHYRKSL